MKTLVERVCARLNTDGPQRWKVRSGSFVTTRLESGRIFYAQQVPGTVAWEALTCAVMSSKVHEDLRCAGYVNGLTGATTKQLAEVVRALLSKAIADPRNAFLRWPRQPAA